MTSELFGVKLKNWTEITGLSKPELRCVLMLSEGNVCVGRVVLVSCDRAIFVRFH